MTTKVPVELSSTPGIVDGSNATAITIDSSENVGIGTTSPNAYSNVTTLTINGTNQGRVDLEYGGTLSGSFLALSGQTQIKASGGSQVMVFEVNDAERMRVDTSGNVGIGNTVATTINSANASGNLVVGSGSGSEGITVYSGNSSLGSLCFADGTSSTSTFTGYITYNHSSNHMEFGAGDGTEKMRIDSSGKVGIGINSPSEELHVAGDRILLEGGSGNGAALSIRADGNAQSAEILIGQGFTNATDDVGFLYNRANNDFVFGTNNTERMRIDSSGRVMVNQTAASVASAGVKMQVNTDILSRGTYAGYFWENRSGITIGSLAGWGGWYSTGTSVHSLYSDGNNIVSINRSSGAYTALSDKNKKKDFEISTVGLAEVMQLQPKKFRMIDDADDAPKKLGFVAQDVENIIPEAYFEDTNEDANGVESTFIGLTDRPIIAALTKAIQEQQTQIDVLQSEINNLKGE